MQRMMDELKPCVSLDKMIDRLIHWLIMRRLNRRIPDIYVIHYAETSSVEVTYPYLHGETAYKIKKMLSTFLGQANERDVI